jgi:undecaprenyl pyrophosphate phosphatase UppP
MRMDAQEDRRMAVISRFLVVGPVLILLSWYLAGQWDMAGPEARAWLQFTGVVGLASVMPLPGTSRSLSELAAHVQWWGWVVIVGLVLTS